ncbi:MAG: hypothetical protein U0807_03495 [Candidatus Binatia bacterium]
MTATYQVPRLASSDLDDERLTHDDLARLDADDLLHEFARTLVALDRVTRADADRPWLLERYRAVVAEQRRRAPHGAPRCR